MIIKDLNKYAKEHWHDYLITITEASKINEKKGSLVRSDKKVYCFDDICKDLFDESQLPASVDGIFIFSEGHIDFIEFKSGFKKNITKKNFNEDKGWCKAGNKVCKEYWDLFFKNQKTETKELISSIRDKAIESYIAFEKLIFPKCVDLDKEVLFKLIVVVDSDEIDAFEDSLIEVTGKECTSNSHIYEIRNSLKRFLLKKDANDNYYFYDEIIVMTVQDFKYYINLKYT